LARVINPCEIYGGGEAVCEKKSGRQCIEREMREKKVAWGPSQYQPEERERKLTKTKQQPKYKGTSHIRRLAKVATRED
jgi:hypothetical protein